MSDVDFGRLRQLVTEPPRLRWDGTVAELGDLLWRYLGGDIRWTEHAGGTHWRAWHAGSRTVVNYWIQTGEVQLQASDETREELSELIARGPQEPQGDRPIPAIRPQAQKPAKPFLPWLDRIKAVVRRMAGDVEWERLNNGLHHRCSISGGGTVNAYLATSKVRVSGRSQLAQDLRAILEPNRPHERRKGGLATECERRAKPKHTAERPKSSGTVQTPAKWTAEQMYEPW